MSEAPLSEPVYERKLGRAGIKVVDEPAHLEWSTGSPHGERVKERVARGERRLIADLPRHSITKVAAFVVGVGAVASLVLLGLLSLTGGGGMPPVARTVAFVAVLAFVGVIGVLMARDREYLEIDARVVLAQQGPLEVLVCRSEITRVAAASGSSAGPAWARLLGVVPRIVALPPADSGAEPLPLTGYGLNGSERAQVVDAVNAFLDEVPADAMFDCRRLATAPSYVALTTPHDPR